MERAATLLPHPEFADHTQSLARLDGKGDAIHSTQDAVAREEICAKPLDGEQWLTRAVIAAGVGGNLLFHDHNALACRGSRASRKPSPNRLTASTVTDRKTLGIKIK